MSDANALDIIKTLAQFGSAGLILIFCWVAWKQMQSWMQQQQIREDARWDQVRQRDEQFIQATALALREQSEATKQTAIILQQTTLELKLIVQSMPNRERAA